MRKIVLAIVSCVACAASEARSDDKRLLIYNWADYTSPELIARFAAQTGIKVTLDTYDNNETLLAKMNATGGGGYDIAVASSDFVPILVQRGLIEKIDANTLPHYPNLAAAWRAAPWDPGNVYSVPWNFGLTSVAVDTAIYKGPLDTLKILFEPPPELVGKLQVYSAPSELMALALTYLGKPPCSADPDTMRALEALLVAQKPSVKVYDSAGSIDRMGSGEVVASQMWSGDALRARTLRASIHYVYPKEGVVAWADNMVLPKGAPHPDAARRWIDFMMVPENSALQSSYTKGQGGIVGAEKYLPPDLAAAPEFNPPPGLKMTFSPTCPETATRAYDRIMTKLRQ